MLFNDHEGSVVNRKKRVLYLSYTGLLEPLGRSQVLAYLSRLSDAYQFTIVSFEKSADFSNTAEVEKLRKECESFNIDWQPKIYHKTPRLLATLWDMFILFFSCFNITKKKNIELVHCRSYIPAIAAWFVGKLTKVPFIFDMRALWPEEMVDAGRLKRSSFIFKSLNYIEGKLLKRSSAIVSLTEVALPYLLKKYPDLTREKFTVIPTCVDLSRFIDSEQTRLIDEDNLVIGTMGTVVSGWYYLDWLANTCKLSKTIFTDPSFKIITKDNQAVINSQFNALGFSGSNVEIFPSAPQDIQKNIQTLSFAILYFTAGISKIGSAPTRMAEFLACGIPILGNRGVGDMADIIEEYNIGVVIENGKDASIVKGLEKMKLLLQDEQLSERCKHAALSLFSADKGADNYRLIYNRVIC